MTCASCSQMIESYVGNQHGVDLVNVNLVMNSGVVVYRLPLSATLVVELVTDVRSLHVSGGTLNLISTLAWFYCLRGCR